MHHSRSSGSRIREQSPHGRCPAFSGFPNDRLSPTGSSLSAHSDGHPEGSCLLGVLSPFPCLPTRLTDPPPLRPRGLCESCDSILWSGTSRTILDYIVPDSECQSYFVQKCKAPRTVFGTGSRCIVELLLGSLILLDEDAQRTDGDLDALRHLGIGHDGGGA